MKNETWLEKLSGMRMKDLLVEAKLLNVVGRHEMNKGELISHIMEKSMARDDVVEEPAQDASGSIEDFEEVMAKAVPAKSEWEGQGATGVDKANAPNKASYIENVVPGSLVAFRVDEFKVLSGIVEEVHPIEFVILTKNGVKFVVRKRNVIWVRTGPRWPRGVYLALKGEVDVENSRLNKTYAPTGAESGRIEAGVRCQQGKDSGIL